jgi:hypothetical protein
MYPFPQHRGPPACVIGLFYFMYRMVMRLPREMNNLSFHQHLPQMKNAEANHRLHYFHGSQRSNKADQRRKYHVAHFLKDNLSFMHPSHMTFILFLLSTRSFNAGKDFLLWLP